jgi:alanyl-tRNA synthetase
MTERLYYTDSYTVRFDAHVREHLTIDDHPTVVLDRSYFYPTSGGQPHDTGLLNNIPVTDVTTRESDGALLHILADALLEDSVHAQVDWARRFDHMQHHTGQHILTQSFVQVAAARTVGFHLSAESVTIDLDTNALTKAEVDEAEDLANRIVWENRTVTARLHAADDVEDVRIRKLPKHLLTEGLRVIDIEGFDVTACGGTHVARTGEIGLIKVLRLEKRGGKTRVEFRCGARALGEFREKLDVAAQMAAALDCRVTEAPLMLNKLRDDYRAQTAALKAVTGQLIEYEAAALATQATLRGGLRVVAQAFWGRDSVEVKLLAGRLVAEPGTIALVGCSGDKAMLFFARSADVDADMGALLKVTLAELGGRGGGQAAFAQGGGVLVSQDDLQAALDRAAAAFGV